ncbi:hypothetical protein ACFL2H_02460 [Planctomycetota bacterium]
MTRSAYGSRESLFPTARSLSLARGEVLLGGDEECIPHNAASAPSAILPALVKAGPTTYRVRPCRGARLRDWPLARRYGWIKCTNRASQAGHVGGIPIVKDGTRQGAYFRSHGGEC